jgi:hypothetical protein
MDAAKNLQAMPSDTAPTLSQYLGQALMSDENGISPALEVECVGAGSAG